LRRSPPLSQKHELAIELIPQAHLALANLALSSVDAAHPGCNRIPRAIADPAATVGHHGSEQSVRYRTEDVMPKLNSATISRGSAGGASTAVGAARVRCSRAMAKGVTAGVGALFGAVG